MDRRFEVRKQEMLAECEVSPRVFRGVRLPFLGIWDGKGDLSD